MKILAAKADWCETFDNHPRLKILVDKMPDHDKRIYKVKSYSGGRRAFFSSTEGLVNFFLHNPKDEKGYAGRVFTAKLEDGSEVKVKGPWSSNYMFMSEEFGVPCTDITITDDPKVWERGYTFYGSNITVELAIEACKMIGVYLLKVTEKGSGGPFAPDASSDQSNIIGGGAPGCSYYIPSLKPTPDKPRVRRKYKPGTIEY